MSYLLRARQHKLTCGRKKELGRKKSPVELSTLGDVCGSLKLSKYDFVTNSSTCLDKSYKRNF